MPSSKQPIIAGAGLSGLIAAHLFPGSPIIEPNPDRDAHSALLRFRSPIVGELTGIPFREVTVRKSIWDYATDRFIAPDPRVAVQYSRKVIGRAADRSVWSIEPVQRWIAPFDFPARLREQHQARIFAGDAFEEAPDGERPIISTAPMPIAIAAAGRGTTVAVAAHGVEFKHKSISVKRLHIPGASMHHTVYIPSPDTSTYRVSITDDILIMESMNVERELPIPGVLSIFGLRGADWEITSAKTEISAAPNQYGKIAEIPDSARRAIIHALTAQRNIFSLGRFATWRNILLDDVVKDAQVVRRLIDASAYGRAIIAAK